MAEFQKVMSEFRRLCKGRRCADCPIWETIDIAKENSCSAWVTNHPEEAEQIIMEWAAEHPIVTNGMKFKEVFGDHVVWETNEDMTAWLNAEYKGGQDE